MNLSNPKLLLSTTLILLITSVKCCIYSTDLAELGQILLKNLNEIDFNDYDAIEDFKKSIEFAINSSIVATAEEVREVATLARVYKREKFILGASDVISHHFNTIFSLLTPYNNYNVEELKNVMEQLNTSTLLKNSVTVFRGMFDKPQRTRKIIKTLEILPHKYQCKKATSVHHRIIGLHNRALLNLIMGFSSIIYLSKQIHRADDDKRTKLEGISQSLLKMYDRYTEQTTSRLHKLTESVSRDIYQCDPDEHEDGKTYERLSHFVEYYLTSERFLNEQNQCSAINQTYDGVKHNSEINKYIDETLLCYGTLYKCERVDLVHLFLYGQDNIYRRYHAFSVANPQALDGETVYGVIGDATVAYTKDDLNGIGEHSPNSADLNLTSTELENLKSCPIYGCLCDEHDSSKTVRYISTKLVTAAVKNNRVITGLKLVVKDGVLYIQIQTGQLIGLGVIDPGSVKWKDVEPVTVTGVDEKSADAEFVKLDYNTRTLYMDDVASDAGFYLSGVRFTRAKDGVRITAQFVPYENLNLVTNQAPWELERSDVNRTELNLDDSIVPQYMSNLNTKPLSVQNQHYIKFQPSDIRTDAGQTTIPFLDIQPVETNPPTALGGYGICLKGQKSSGYFVALKLISPK